ncbi:MAG TPA: pitrilysin family protein [Chloroflexota bacterium]
MTETRHTVLSNGLKVITREVHHVPIATFWVWYRVGSRNEVPGLTGISHWVEHMMFKGTPNLDKGDIFRRVNANGGVLNGFTWLDYTAYFETLPSSRVQLPIDIESDRMANSVFDPDEVASERTVIISEREGSENSPGFLLGEEIGAIAFQAHPYGHSVVGWKSDLQTMTRDDLFRHYKSYYTPNNATIVAVGDFQTGELLERIREKFEPIPAGPEVPPVRAAEPPQRGERRVTVRYPAGVPHLEIAYRAAAASHADAFPLLVLDAVLSGGKPMGMFGSRGTRMGRSARLYRGLVDSGLTSGAGSSMALTRDPYLFEIDASLRPGVTLEQVEKAAFEEVERLQQDGVSDEELRRAVKQVKAQFVYASESVTDQGYWLGAMETIGTPKVYSEMVERVEAVTAEAVQRVATEYLSETNRTVGWLIPTDGNGAGGDGGRAAGARPFFYSGGAQAPYGGDGRGISLDIRRTELPNGPVVLSSRDDSTPQVIVRASLSAGSVFDSPDKAGIARFAASMLMRGTEVRSFQQLSEETDSLGMAVSTDAGRLTAQVALRCLREDLPRGMEILAELLRRPTFPEDEIERLRMQIIAGLREQETSARAVAERRFLELIYPEGHPYHLWPAGTQETIGSISRDELVAFYHRYYRPDSLVVAIAGDVSPDEAVDQVRRVLGDWRAGGEKPEITIPPVELTGRRTDETVVQGKFQSEMVMGLPALARNDPDYYSLRVGNLILGELGLSGRLGANIREKQGLAYHVSSDVQASVGPSPWAVRAGINPANLDRAIESAFAEIEKWREQPVTAEELDEARSFLTGSLPIALETADGLVRTMLDIEFYKLGLDFLERYPALIDAVTPESIRAAVRKWVVPEHIVTVVAGPAREA